MGKRKNEKSSSEQSGPSKKSKKNMKMMGADDDWDSGDEVMLNIDDIFGGDDEVSDGDQHVHRMPGKVEPVKVNRRLATFHRDIGMTVEDILEMQKAMLKKEEKIPKTTVSTIAARNYPPPKLIVFHDPTRNKKVCNMTL